MISNKTNKIKAAITAVGGYIPQDFISNKDLEQMVDTNDEWITARTGIKKRRILKEKGKVYIKEGNGKIFSLRSATVVTFIGLSHE